jgi:hypothetical protein
MNGASVTELVAKERCVLRRSLLVKFPKGRAKPVLLFSTAFKLVKGSIPPERELLSGFGLKSQTLIRGIFRRAVQLGKPRLTILAKREMTNHRFKRNSSVEPDASIGACPARGRL